jgi:hypothetical protein
LVQSVNHERDEKAPHGGEVVQRPSGKVIEGGNKMTRGMKELWLAWLFEAARCTN